MVSSGKAPMGEGVLLQPDQGAGRMAFAGLHGVNGLVPFACHGFKRAFGLAAVTGLLGFACCAGVGLLAISSRAARRRSRASLSLISG